MTLQVINPDSEPGTGSGIFGGGSGAGTAGGTGGSTSGSAPGLSPGGAALEVKVLFFRVGFDMEVMPIESWSYNGPFGRAEMQATTFNDTGIFHSVPDGPMHLEIAQGEVVRWAESSDPSTLVDTLDASTAIEDLHQSAPGSRVTRTVIDPFMTYLRAIIIGPATGIQTRIRSLGDYDHPPSTLTAGRRIVVVK